MAAKRRRKKKLTRGQFWGLVLSASVAAALCLLITISGRMSEPFLPTWEELLGYIDGRTSPDNLWIPSWRSMSSMWATPIPSWCATRG